jgi:hypothetical protein
VKLSTWLPAVLGSCAVAAFAAAGGACSSSSARGGNPDGGEGGADAATDTGGGTEGGGEGGGGDSGGDGGVNCRLSNAGAPQPTVVHVSSPFPSGTGGTLVSGTYFWTEVDEYDADGGADHTSFAPTLCVVDTSAMTLNFAGSADGGLAYGWLYSTSGGNLNLTDVCGDAGMVVSPYSATSTTFTLIDAPTGPFAGVVQVFTKQ